MTPERMEEVSMSAEDEMFEALIAASGVPVRDDEKSDLRNAYTSLMQLARRTRHAGRNWEVRTLPHFVPEPPEGAKD
jgi:hypothetical protein